MNWMTNAEFVASVALSGALGTLGPNAGQTSLTSDPVQTADRLRREILKAQEILDAAPSVPGNLAVNVVVRDPNATIDGDPFLGPWLAACFDTGINAYAVVGSPNPHVFDAIKKHGGTIVFRPLTPTAAAARQAEALGADILVATGREEGGLLPDGPMGTFTAVPAMVDAVSIPVFAAGGINDARSVAAAFTLGAQGVYVGSRFLATKESPAAQAVKNFILDSSGEDLVEVSETQRSLPTPAALRYAAEYAASHDGTPIEQDLMKKGGLRPGMLVGDFDEGVVTVNSGIGVIQDIPTVGELVERLASGIA